MATLNAAASAPSGSPEDEPAAGAAAAAAANAASTTLARAEAVLSAANESAMRAEAAASDARANVDAQTAAAKAEIMAASASQLAQLTATAEEKVANLSVAAEKAVAAALATMPPPLPPLSNATADSEFLANWQTSSKEPHDSARARKRWKYAYTRVRALNIFKQQGVGVLSSRVQKGSSIAERIARLEVRKHQIACPPFALSP